MYYFSTKGNTFKKSQKLFTEFSPKEINKMTVFQAYDKDANQVIVQRSEVNFKTVEFKR
jgi:hypothetical protein